MAKIEVYDFFSPNQIFEVRKDPSQSSLMVRHSPFPVGEKVRFTEFRPNVKEGYVVLMFARVEPKGGDQEFAVTFYERESEPQWDLFFKRV
jgi:hypothetical protein